MAKLKISTGVIKAALDHSLNGVCIVQSVIEASGEKKGRVVFVNQAFCEMAGYRREDLLGKYPELFTTESIHFNLKDTTPTVMEGEIQCEETSVTSTRQVLTKFTHFEHEEQHYTMGSFQDRTELTQTKNQAKDLQDENSNLYEQVGMTITRFTALLENFPDVVWECDDNFCYTFVSDNAEEILGYPSDTLIGQPVYTHMREEFQEFFQEAFNQEEALVNLQRVSVTHCKPDGNEITLEISGNVVLNAERHPRSMIGTSRDVTALLQLEEESKELSEGMTVKVDDQLRMVYVSSEVLDFLSEYSEETPPSIEQFLTDATVGALFTFAFDQNEDMPFPVELQLKDATESPRNFQVDFQFNAEEGCLEGQLIPANTNDQLAVMSQKMEKQKESLESAVVMDEEMQATVIEDSQNLASEILSLIKSLEPFGYPQEDNFQLEAYGQFLEGKNIQSYEENVRLLGNKIHGLKGTSGFLIPASKQLCHHVEDLTRPLAEHQLVLTTSLAQLLKQFIFKVQEMLEEYQKDPQTVFDLDTWMARIDTAFEQGSAFLGSDTEALTTLIANQSLKSEEKGERKVDEFISVSSQGYEFLSEQVQTLFYMASENLKDDSLVKAGGIYNEFLDTHQKIIKVPPDLSRYERLIPTWAKEYGKEAEFIFQDHGVYADREFWNSMHEIFNHSLKNAVIHGLEEPEEREASQKGKLGQVIVEIQEDALHLYLSIIDDGRGINVDKMKAKALENRVIGPEQAQAMSKEEILNLVFVQGVSTAEALDDNAGRGVGMNAVQEAMQQFQGKVKITSEIGQGTSWNFSFPKSNVSLPCFIVTIGGFQIAIPENHVEAFYGFRQQHIRQVNQKQVFRRADEIIPLLNSKRIFDEAVCVNEEHIRRILILQAEQHKIGMVINDIIHHATLPILPLPEEYREIPVYLGATLYGNQPVLVLNANQMFVN